MNSRRTRRRTTGRPGEPGAVVYGVTIASSARAFLVGQLNLLAQQRQDVLLIVGTDEGMEITGLDDRVELVPVQLVRDPAPLGDLRSLQSMVRILRRICPATVVLGTPKMGLVGLLAARLVGVPRRIYILYGLRLEGSHGWARRALWVLEWLTVRCATEVVALSPSSRDELVRRRLAPREKVDVLGLGSICGVDLDRFGPPSETDRLRARERFDLPAGARVVGFVGRLAPDKGLGAMAEVWRRVVAEDPDAWLLVVGPDEATPAGQGALVEALRNIPRVRLAGPVGDPEGAFAAMDVFLLLTRREGFGQVILEAGACAVPTVASRVTGTVDAVIDGTTGTLVPLGDTGLATDAVLSYLREPDLARRHGLAARGRTVAEFASTHVVRLWVDHVDGAVPVPTTERDGR